MLVKELMTPNPVVVPPEMTIAALVQLLADRHVSGVFVVDRAGVPLGVVTEADLICRLAPGPDDAELGWLSRLFVDLDDAAARYARSHGQMARDLMSQRLVAVDADAPAGDAAQLMQTEKVRRVAVLHDGKLVGVVSRADLLKAVRPAAPIAAGRDDADIRAAIVREMERHPWATGHFTTVTVQGGVVRLEGFCRSDDARQALRVLAGKVQGVKEVVDNTELAPGFPPISPI